MRILRAFLFFLITVVNGDVMTFENGALSSLLMYPSHPAAFGSNISSDEFHKANLLIAPFYDRQLCKSRNNVRLDKRGLELDKKDLDQSVNIYEREDWNNQTIQNHLDIFRNDVALLVRRGGCSFLTKARNALSLNSMYNNIFSNKRIKYLIVYNNDQRPHKKNTLLYMHSERPADDIDLGLLFVSYASGSYLLEQLFDAAHKLEDLGVMTLARYFDFGYASDFIFPVYLNGEIPYQTQRETSTNRELNFYDALRFILISLLIIIPSCRALFLWFKGGGRIKWRRDPETNRINGIIIVRPRPRWLCNYQRRTLYNPTGGEINTDERNSEQDTRRKLTKEQVLALPEIEFKGENKKEDTKQENITHTETVSTSTTSSSSNDVKNNQHCLTNKDELNLNDNSENSLKDEKKPAEASVVPLSIEKNSEQTSSNKNDTPTSMDEESLKQHDSSKPCVAYDPDEEIPSVCIQESKNDVYKISSSVNVCSICIEDFEAGEKLRLLPLCGHVFHTECIMPWLTERSGSCPLCKQLVLEDDKNDDDSTGENDNSTET